MRLIDADALLMHLADAVFGNAPNGNEPPDERDLKRAWCDGMESAEEAVKAAPTVLQETDLDETEQRILRKFRELREKGRANKYIHNPTAWALYWTWKDLETWSNVIDRKEADHDAD